MKDFVFAVFLGASEPKVQVYYCGYALSVVHPSFTSHIFDFSSETAKQITTELDRKYDLLYKI